VTFGNGTTKTIQEGFTITAFNTTHSLVTVTVWEEGQWTWHWITDNSVVYLDIDPRVEDGLQYNVTIINYDIRIANGSNGLINQPITIEVKDPLDNVLDSQQKVTGSNGWVNSSISSSSNWEMTSNQRLYLSVTSTNQSFLGYEVEYLLGYQDFVPPTITKIEYDVSTVESLPKVFYITVIDTWTETDDIEVVMYYGYVSSGSLSEISYLSYVGSKFEVTVAGKPADTTIWFKFIVTDNMSNNFETDVFDAVWTETPPTGDSGTDNGDSPAIPSPQAPSGGDSNIFLILIFALGAVFSAILIVGVYRRVTVRTRKVEEREVISVFGRTGQAKEKIEEKGN
jgi:hypothetical protein